MIKDKLVYIDRLLTIVAICLLLSMCVRPTIAQQCGFGLLEQPRYEVPVTTERSNDIYTFPIVVHVIYNSADPLGVGSNITDAQVIAMIDDLNNRMEFNPLGDTQLRFCFAEIDPDGNTTTGITRSTYSTEYDQNGVSVSGGAGVPDGTFKQAFGWPQSDYYNIYVVPEINGNDGGSGIQGYAYFPINNYLDGTVVLANKMQLGETTLVHEIGHAFWLYHTFESTTGCSETDCTTQGDRVCDTPPSPSWAPCANHPLCSVSPYFNFMSYSSCRSEFTQGQIDRSHTAVTFTARQSLLESNVCDFDADPPTDPEFCDDPCPNDVCENAISLNECTPVDFCNVNCTTEAINILTHPVVSTVHCGGTVQYLGQWFEFVVTNFGYYQMTLIGDFQSAYNQTGNYGELEGVQWKLAKGDCDSLEWIAASSCPSNPTNCFCGPVGPSAWAGLCESAPCADPYELTPFWWTLSPPQFPTGDWLPYDPTRQEWNMTFPLSPGTYYFLITSFTPGDSQGNTYPSYGSGTIEICHETPLSIQPILHNSGMKLYWEGETATDWAIFRFDGLNWHELARTTQKEFKASESGYYIVAGSTGFSNIIFLEIQSIYEPRYRFDILGRQGAKFWIK